MNRPAENKDKKFENRVILKLKRKYSKNEEMGLILQKLSKTEVELGKWKSYATEIETVHKDKKHKYMNELNSLKSKVMLLKHEVKQLNKQIIEDDRLVTANKRIKHLQDGYYKITNKYLSLKIKYEKETGKEP